jgi:hypothetical protein
MPLEEFARLRGIELSEPVRKDIDGKMRGAAYTIIDGKGATYYGIGSARARIVDVILHDQRAVVTGAHPRRTWPAFATSQTPCPVGWVGKVCWRRSLSRSTKESPRDWVKAQP